MRGRFAFRRLGRGLGAVLALALAVALAYWAEGGRGTAPSVQPAARTAGGVPAGRYVLTGTVVKVSDGDTVILRVRGARHRVRLDSIDAPESGRGAQEPGQPYAQASRRHLERLVGGKTLTAQCYEQDQFRRDVCALMLPDGSSANRAQVAAGYAWAYTARRGDYLRDAAMPELQRQARQAGSGLWGQAGATEPWKWRYECWRNQRCQ